MLLCDIARSGTGLSVNVTTDGRSDALQVSNLVDKLFESTTIGEIESTLRTASDRDVAKEIVLESITMLINILRRVSKI